MASYFDKLKRQIKALTKKNLYNIRPNWVVCVFLILSPSLYFLSCLLLVFVHFVYRTITVGRDISTSQFSVDLNEFPECINFDKYILIKDLNAIRNGSPYTPSNEKDRCLTVAFGPITNETLGIMNEFAQLSKLKMGVDIIGEGKSFYQLLLKNPKVSIMTMCIRHITPLPVMLYLAFSSLQVRMKSVIIFGVMRHISISTYYEV